VGLWVAACVAAVIVGAATLRAASWMHAPAADHAVTILADSAGRVRHAVAPPRAAAPAHTAADDTRVAPPLRRDSL